MYTRLLWGLLELHANDLIGAADVNTLDGVVDEQDVVANLNPSRPQGSSINGRHREGTMGENINGEPFNTRYNSYEAPGDLIKTEV